MLVLELFGRLALRRDDGLVPPEARQKRRIGLLAVLALGGKRGMSRHRVEAFLWPESDAARSRHALDQTIYAVRRMLGTDVIVAAGQELSLNPQLVAPDVWEFDDAIVESDWATAIRCYDGPLLDGYRFGESHELEAWIETERARRLQQYRKAIESSADSSEASGDVQRHVALRRDHADADPFSARAAKKLIAVLAAAGDRATAVKHGRAYQQLVRRELEIEPDIEIERLISELNCDPSADPDASVDDSRSAPPLGADASTLPTPPVPTRAREITATEALEEPRAWRSLPNDRRRRMAFDWRATLVAVAVGALTLTAYVRSRRNGPVAGALENGRRSASRPPLPAAREAYLRGMSVWEDRTRAGNDSAVVYFRSATEIDPGYAEAYAELAEAYVRIGYFGYRPAEAMFPKARAAALRSLELDSTLASARTALASAMMWAHDFRGAESQYSRAISFDSTNATAHQWYGVLLMILGRAREAVKQERKASDLEPLSLQIQNNYATFLNIAGDRAGALRQFHKSVAEEPDSGWVHRNPWLLQNMSRVYADDGDYTTASRLIDQALAIVPRSPRLLHTRAVIFDEMGRPDLALQAFTSADTSNEQYAAYRGMVYADQGSANAAFHWFAREANWGIQPMLSLQSDPRLVRFRGDDRYAELLVRLGIHIR